MGAGLGRRSGGSRLGTGTPMNAFRYRSFFDRCVGSSILASLSEAGGTIHTNRTASPFPLARPLGIDRHVKRTRHWSKQTDCQSVSIWPTRKCPRFRALRLQPSSPCNFKSRIEMQPGNALPPREFDTLVQECGINCNRKHQPAGVPSVKLGQFRSGSNSRL